MLGHYELVHDVLSLAVQTNRLDIGDKRRVRQEREIERGAGHFWREPRESHDLARQDTGQDANGKRTTQESVENLVGRKGHGPLVHLTIGRLSVGNFVGERLGLLRILLQAGIFRPTPPGRRSENPISGGVIAFVETHEVAWVRVLWHGILSRQVIDNHTEDRVGRDEVRIIGTILEKEKCEMTKSVVDRVHIMGRHHVNAVGGVVTHEAASHKDHNGRNDIGPAFIKVPHGPVHDKDDKASVAKGVQHGFDNGASKRQDGELKHSRPFHNHRHGVVPGNVGHLLGLNNPVVILIRAVPVPGGEGEEKATVKAYHKGKATRLGPFTRFG